tara:strand:+ start:4293 stop:4529 length:237 start_codon:yes stop_codon:yes gene_type:complete
MWKEYLELWRDFIPQLIIVLTSLAAGIFWFLSSQVEISNNLDTIVAELQWASQLSSYAALSASVAAFFGIIRFIRKWL